MSSFAAALSAFAQTVGPASRLRIAPTPSGFLHLGNGLNFALIALLAQASPREKAQVLLRIDDLDADRKRDAYEQDIFDTLQWLQIIWDHAPVRQSDAARKLGYESLLSQLRDTGLVFACQKSRRELEVFQGKYPDEFRNQGLDLDAPNVAWRIQTPPEFPLPDFVIRRRDGIASYQVASLADDLEMRITHLVRGKDLENSTLAQQYLASLIAADHFLKIKVLHHPLLLGVSGEKLSKSAGATALKTLREAGESPRIVYKRLGEWLDVPGETASALQESLRTLVG